MHEIEANVHRWSNENILKEILIWRTHGRELGGTIRSRTGGTLGHAGSSSIFNGNILF